MREEEKQQLIEKYIKMGILNQASFENDETIMHKLVQDDNLEMVASLYEKGASLHDKTDCGNTLCHFAALNGNVAMLSFLSERGLSLSYINDERDTPLMYASGNQKYEAVKFILDKEPCTINYENARGMSALSYAVNGYSLSKSFKVMDLLIDQGADINVQHRDGSTLLESPLRQGQLNVVSHLIDKGLDVNADFKMSLYSEECTPLTYAVKNKDVDLLKLLLSKGANANKRDKMGNFALEIAVKSLLYAGVENKDTPLSMIEVLLSHGANKNQVQHFDTIIQKEIKMMKEYQDPVLIAARQKEAERLSVISRMQLLDGHVRG